jgi:hypothetical protein
MKDVPTCLPEAVQCTSSGGVFPGGNPHQASHWKKITAAWIATGSQRVANLSGVE